MAQMEQITVHCGVLTVRCSNNGLNNPLMSIVRTMKGEECDNGSIDYKKKKKAYPIKTSSDTHICDGLNMLVP